MIDVVPLGPGDWLARCECGTTAHFPTSSAGWAWVLAHPCDSVEDAATESAARPATIDLNDVAPQPTPGRCG